MGKAAAPIFHTARSVRRQPAFSPLDKSRPFFLLGITSLLLLTIVGAILYIAIRVKAVNLGYRINQEIQLKDNLIEENKRLELDIARLKSPPRIEHEAQAELGLALPESHQIVYLKKTEPAELDKFLALVKPLEQKNPTAPGDPPGKTQDLDPEKLITQKSPDKKAPLLASQKSNEPKVSSNEKPGREPPKVKAQPASSAVKAKESSQIVVASSTADSSQGVKAPVFKRKENVPAIMLDPMP